MKWNGLSNIQKALYAIGGACAVVWVVLTFLPAFGLGTAPDVVRYGLLGGTALCWALMETKKTTKIMWFALAAAEFLFCAMHFLKG